MSCEKLLKKSQFISVSVEAMKERGLVLNRGEGILRGVKDGSPVSFSTGPHGIYALIAHDDSKELVVFSCSRACDML